MASPDKLCTESEVVPSVFNIAFFDDLNDSTDGDRDEEERRGVAEWLNGLGLGRYIAPLGEEGFDHFSIIQDLDEDDVEQLIEVCRMPRLHARQFRRALERVLAERFGAAANQDCMRIPAIECTVPDIGANTDHIMLESAPGGDKAGQVEDLGAVPYRISNRIFEAEVELDAQEKWNCPKCDEPNRLARERCNNCGVSKPKPQKWTCPKYDDVHKESDEKAMRLKKTTMNVNSKCTKQHDKNKRKKANKKLAREREDEEFLNQTQDL